MVLTIQLSSLILHLTDNCAQSKCAVVIYNALTEKLLLIINCRYCPYPQQFVVCLKSQARLRKIQLLSHEYMIGKTDQYCMAWQCSSHQTARLKMHLITVSFVFHSFKS